MSMRPLLWQVLRKAAGDPGALRAILEDATAEQLILLNRRFGIAAGQLHADPGFAAHADPGESWRLATWVVGQGQRAWHEARKDPASLPKKAPADAPDYPSIMESVYEARYGAPIPDQEPDPAGRRDLRPTPELERQMWDVIDSINEGIPAEEALAQFTRSELVSLYEAYEAMSDRVRHEFSPMLGEDPDGLDWLAWADWLVSRGREAIDEYRAHPDRLPRAIPEGAPKFVVHQLHDVYASRYGANVPRSDDDA